MPGPDFEIPPLTAPPQPESAEPVAPRPSWRRRAALPALVLVLGLGAAAAYWGPSRTTSPETPALASSTIPTTALASTTSLAPSTTLLRTPGRTCDEGEGEAPPLQTRPAGVATPGITLSYSPRASDDALGLISDALAQAREAYGESGALLVRVHCDVEQYVAESRRSPDEVRKELSDGLVAQVLRGDIWIYGPNFGQRPVSERRRVVYHEYFHAVQRLLSRNRSAQRPGMPLWLIEGSARYFEYAVQPQDAETFRRLGMRRFGALPPLAELEHAGGGIGTGGSGEAYAVGAVASAYLVDTYGRALLQHEFWVAASRTDWHSAFAEVFGVTVDDFYAEFEAYRATLRP